MNTTATLKIFHDFSSPGAAASVIHGGQANGLVAWRDAKGRTLKELEEKGLSNREGPIAVEQNGARNDALG